MPLKIKAIIDTIKDTPLCYGSLTLTLAENSLHCVMGELLHSLGITNDELRQMDGIGSGVGGYWASPIVEKYKPQLAEKFGITSVSDMHKLVRLNDSFHPFTGENAIARKERTCHIMKNLVGWEQINAAQD